MKTLYALTMTWLVAAAVNAAPLIRNVSSLTAPSGRWAGLEQNSSFSHGMDFVGDLNGDGFDDLAIGAYRQTVTGVGVATGSVYVLFGSTTPFAPGAAAPGNLNGSNGFTIIGPAVQTQTGFAVAAAGDFNGDGLADMVISNTTQNVITPSAYIIFGRSSYPAVLDLANPPSGYGFRVTQQTGIGNFGWALSAADLNNDGRSDVIISNWELNQVLVVFGQTAAPNALIDISALSATSSPRAVRFTDGALNTRFGFSVRGTPDLNRDGIDDMLVGAPFANAEDGRFNVIYGRANVAGDLAFSNEELIGGFGTSQGMAFTAGSLELDGGRLGTAVTVGDINGDDFLDFIVGAQTAKPLNRTQAGAVYTVYGTGSNSAVYSRDVRDVINAGGGMILNGAAAGDVAGSFVGVPGDVDGDGLIDLVVGSHVASGSGRFYVVYGRQSWPIESNLGTLDEHEGQIWVGAAQGDALGRSLAQSGDFNGDGLADVAVGALLGDAGPGALQNVGTAYLLLDAGRPFCNGFEALRCR